MSARSRFVGAAGCAALMLVLVVAAPAGAGTGRVARNATEARPHAGVAPAVHSSVPRTDEGAGWFSYPGTGSVASASVTFTMPAFSCHSQSDSEWLSPGIWVYDNTGALTQFSGVEFNCNSGVLFQGDVICLDSHAVCNNSLAVNPGDRVEASFVEVSTGTTAAVRDLTTGQRVQITGGAATNDYTVFLGDEGPALASNGAVTKVPTFSKVAFSKAQVNGFYLGDWGPSRYNLKTNAALQEKTGVLSHDGDGFTTTFVHN